MKKDTRMPTRRILTLLLTTALAALTLTTPPATAGTETVYTCRNADGTPGTDVDWKRYAYDDPNSTGGVGYLRACGTGQPLSASLIGDRFSVSEYSSLQFEVEEPLRVVRLLSLDRETTGISRGADNADRIWYLGEKAFTPGYELDKCVPAPADAPESCGPDANIARATRSSFPDYGPPGAGWAMVMACTATASNSYCTAPAGRTPTVRVYAAQFAVTDSTDPSVGRVTGAVADDETLRGSAGLVVNASDSGSGVYQIVLKADGQVVDTQIADPNGGACADNRPGNADPYEFGQAVPCRLSVSRALSLDTTKLPEGPVAIQVLVRDATGNEAVAVNRTVTVDNVPGPKLVAQPFLGGTPSVGRSLVVDPGRWDGAGRPVTYAYHWLRCTPAGTGCEPVEGRTGVGYDLAEPDAGHSFVAEVTAATDQGATTVRTSPSTPVGGGSDGRGALNGENASDQARLTASFTSTSRRSVTSRYGRHFAVAGTLRTADGAPIRNAVIDVATRASSPGAGLVQRAQVRTSASGAWELRAAPGTSSRALRFTYRSRLGDPRVAAEAGLVVRVRAAVGLKITPRHTGNRGTIRFTGRLRGGPVPGHGKLIELQARGKGGGQWLTFRTLRTDRRGIYATRYRFHATYGPVTYDFRVRVRAEAAYPYLTGASRTVSVRVG